MDFSDEQIYSLALEGNEDARNIIYEKYKYIVDILLKKYYTAIKNLGIDKTEIEQEAYYAFSDALSSYRDDKNASLSTFISLCVDRRIKKMLKRASGEKAKLLGSIYSLDYDYEDNVSLRELISDDSKTDPLYSLANEEEYEELIEKIKEALSTSEYEVFEYLVNGFDHKTIQELININGKQFDNRVQKIKQKIRDILGEN